MATERRLQPLFPAVEEGSELRFTLDWWLLWQDSPPRWAWAPPPLAEPLVVGDSIRGVGEEASCRDGLPLPRHPNPPFPRTSSASPGACRRVSTTV
ncbi:hypothetical protein COCON_G00081660 [Conger conger]|uniref:Uncharacterized protein n=1 Tax=Conger conger TaxID=82655 RepID=A0A9Q1DPS3_CONCO|nr:hypothetical protein COCON_G00081660 [Conger conger]